MSRPCMLEGGPCDEEAQPNSPFCPAHEHEHSLTHSFAYCERHEVVHLSYFRCPACVLQDELGFRMDVIHDRDPKKSSGRYVKGQRHVKGWKEF